MVKMRADGTVDEAAEEFGFGTIMGEMPMWKLASKISTEIH